MSAPEIRFGLIGGGLMGKEFASACARWFHLAGDVPPVRLVAVCDHTPRNVDWFRRVPGVERFYGDYRALLADPSVDAAYVALPNLLHEEVCAAVLDAGKHLLGEKPFGIDLPANAGILAAARRNPGAFVRCSGEFPFYPGAQQLLRWHAEGRFGRILEARFAIRHSSDLDPAKPISWKRQVRTNGAYGCMGDLGLHVQQVPFRLGFRPLSVAAVLSDVVRERPDGKGGTAACDTWDNATLLCRSRDAAGDEFPVTYEMKRMSPGAKNVVEYAVYGTEMAAVFSTDDPDAVRYTVGSGGEMDWARKVLGQRTAFPTITGPIFGFGFPDALLQMLASFACELRGQPVPFACATPEETRRSHLLMMAALRSEAEGRTVPVDGWDG